MYNNEQKSQHLYKQTDIQKDRQPENKYCDVAAAYFIVQKHLYSHYNEARPYHTRHIPRQTIVIREQTVIKKKKTKVKKQHKN